MNGAPTPLLDSEYARGAALADVRILARLVKTLSRHPDFDKCSTIREMYVRYVTQLLLLREQVAHDFPRPSAPRVAPTSVLQRMYDHHKDLRFQPRDLDIIARALLPEKVVAYRNGEKQCAAHGVVALGVVLRHLAFPERQDRQAEFWGRSPAWVSSIFHATLELLYEHAQRSFRRWNPHHFGAIPRYCEAMAAKSDGLVFAHALLDGSGLCICRPSTNSGADQQQYYSGNERCHVMRILGLVSLSGLFVRIFGSYPGSASDESIYRLEDLEQQLDQLHDRAVASFDMAKRPQIATDSGLPSSKNVATPFGFDPNASSMSYEHIYGVIHSRVRVPNEWGFGRVVNLFQTLQFKPGLKTGWTEPQKQYLVGLLMTNCVVCCEGSQTEKYFGVLALALEAYLSEVTQ
jgi:hypothetical protein